MVYWFNVYIDGQNRTDEVLNIFARNLLRKYENIDPMEWMENLLRLLD